MVRGSTRLFGFANGGMAQIVQVVVGKAIIEMAMLTDYELGAVKTIPLNFHLGTDVAAGLFLAVYPWVFGFADFVF